LPVPHRCVVGLLFCAELELKIRSTRVRRDYSISNYSSARPYFIALLPQVSCVTPVRTIHLEAADSEVNRENTRNRTYVSFIRGSSFRTVEYSMAEVARLLDSSDLL
jgi:hypothetical protein